MKEFIKILFGAFLLFTWGSGFAQQHAFSNEIKEFKTQDQAQMPEKNSILFVGSSSFRMWKEVQAAFPDFKIINRGFGGSALSDVIYYSDDIIFPYQPKQVVIYCGENDLTEPNLDAAVVFDRFKILFELIRKHYPDIPITFVSMKPSPSRKNYRAAQEAGNAAIKYFLSLQKNTSFVDVYHLMIDKSGNPFPDIFRSDSLHMNAKGYEIWQQAIRPHLVK
jgi:lysophospholipase L1-like esterase